MSGIAKFVESIADRNRLYEKRAAPRPSDAQVSVDMKEKQRTPWKAVEGEAFAVKPTNVDLADEELRRFTGALSIRAFSSQRSTGGV